MREYSSWQSGSFCCQMNSTHILFDKLSNIMGDAFHLEFAHILLFSFSEPIGLSFFSPDTVFFSSTFYPSCFRSFSPLFFCTKGYFFQTNSLWLGSLEKKWQLYLLLLLLPLLLLLFFLPSGSLGPKNPEPRIIFAPNSIPK